MSRRPSICRISSTEHRLKLSDLFDLCEIATNNNMGPESVVSITPRTDLNGDNTLRGLTITRPKDTP